MASSSSRRHKCRGRRRRLSPSSSSSLYESDCDSYEDRRSLRRRRAHRRESSDDESLTHLPSRKQERRQIRCSRRSLSNIVHDDNGDRVTTKNGWNASNTGHIWVPATPQIFRKVETIARLPKMAGMHPTMVIMIPATPRISKSGNHRETSNSGWNASNTGYYDTGDPSSISKSGNHCETSNNGRNGIGGAHSNHAGYTGTAHPRSSHVQSDRPRTCIHHANLQRKADPVLLSSPSDILKFLEGTTSSGLFCGRDVGNMLMLAETRCLAQMRL
jgi:hypothetical protein